MALTPHDTTTVLASAAHILKLERHCCHQCDSEGKTLTGQHGPPSPHVQVARSLENLHHPHQHITLAGTLPDTLYGVCHAHKEES